MVNLKVNFKEPASLFRVLIIVFSLLCTVLMISCVAVDEYAACEIMGAKTAVGTQRGAAGAKGADTFSYRTSGSFMLSLSLVTIIFSSISCFVLAGSLALHVLSLIKDKKKQAKPVTFGATALLIALVIIVNFNFTNVNSHKQSALIASDPGIIAAVAEYAATQGAKALGGGGGGGRGSYGDFGGGGGFGGWRKKRASGFSTLCDPIAWSHSYGLLCSALAFSMLNCLLVSWIDLAEKSGGSSLGAFFSALKTSITSYVTDKGKISRLLIFILSTVSLVLMILSMISDKFISWNKGMLIAGIRNRGDSANVVTVEFKMMLTIGIVHFAMAIILCVVQGVSVIVNALIMFKDKQNLAKPAMGISGLLAVLYIATLIVCCMHFTEKNFLFPSTKWAFSFNCFITSFVFALLNIGLSVVHMKFAKS